MKRQGPSASNACPIVGARIGTRKKIICASEVIRAMARPE